MADAAFCDHCGLPLKQRLLFTALAPSGTAAATVEPLMNPSAVPARAGGMPGGVSSTANTTTDAASAVLHDAASSSSAAAPPAPTAAATPLSWTTQRWIAPGAALASVLVLALGSVIWQAAAPPPTNQDVLEALRKAHANIKAPSNDLLCLRNLPYHRHHIQAKPDDKATRDWLDALVQAGLYASPVEIIPDSLSHDTLLQYQALPAINAWRRAGRLCVAEKWTLVSVLPGSIRKDVSIQPPPYVASVVWRAEGAAPWLTKLPNLDGRLVGVSLQQGSLITSNRQKVVQRLGQWVIAE